MISYYKYYEELKNRTFLSLSCWIFVTLICYFYKETILFLLINSSSFAGNAQEEPYFIFTDISEIFYVYLQLTFFISNQVMILMILYHSLLFLSSGLYKAEYKKLQFAFKVGIVSWISSVFLLTKFLIPMSWSFFLSFQHAESISFFFEAKIEEYFNYFTSLYYICFLNCQLLALITLVLNSFITDLKRVRKFRKLFYVLFVIFSTITTPPDIVSQVLMSGSLIIFYELLLFFYVLKTNKVTN